jgi:hypothetical protein
MPTSRCRTRFGRTIATTLILSSLAVGSPSAVHAQANDGQRAAARALATDGLRAIEEGRWAAGIDLFQRAEALVHATPHLLYIARASVKEGKLVQANEAYMKILHEELSPRAPKVFVDARKSATEEQAALAPRLPKLTIVVQGAASHEASVTMDGAAVAPALVGVPQPADPGPHVLRATAPGWTSDDVNVTLAEGATETATIELSHRSSVAAQSGSEEAGGQSAAPGGGAGISPLVWVAFGIGAAGIGAGTLFMLQNRSKRDEANALCPEHVCPSSRRAEIEGLDSSADNAATMAWIGYGVGAAGIIAGATLLLIGKSSSPSSSSASVKPWVGAGSAGLVGRF